MKDITEHCLLLTKSSAWLRNMVYRHSYISLTLLRFVIHFFPCKYTQEEMCIAPSIGFQNMAVQGERKSTEEKPRLSNIEIQTKQLIHIFVKKKATSDLWYRQIKPLSGSQKSLWVTSRPYAPQLLNWPQIMSQWEHWEGDLVLNDTFQSIIYICLCLSGKTWDGCAAFVWSSPHLWAGSKILYLAQENSKGFPPCTRSAPEILNSSMIMRCPV